MVLGGNIWSPPSQEAANEYREFTAKKSCDDILNLYSARCENGTLDSSDKSGPVASAILNAVQNGSSFSLVRMSDGEGNCLFNLDKYPALQKYALRRISYMHFGDEAVVDENRDAFLNYMQTAIQSADVIGVPEDGAILRGYQTPEENLDVRAVVGNRAAALSVAALHTNDQTTASAWTNRHLLGHYGKIFSGQQRVGVISSYPELGELMRQNFGIQDVVQHQIPRQAVFVNAADRKNSRHYPEEFDQIVQSLDPQPGMPYLVSAGLLAKYYCHIIKQRGGVAIDAGSVPEIWLGIPNRGLSSDFIKRWKLV